MSTPPPPGTIPNAIEVDIVLIPVSHAVRAVVAIAVPGIAIAAGGQLRSAIVDARAILNSTTAGAGSIVDATRPVRYPIAGTVLDTTATCAWAIGNAASPRAIGGKLTRSVTNAARAVGDSGAAQSAGRARSRDSQEVARISRGWAIINPRPICGPRARTILDTAASCARTIDAAACRSIDGIAATGRAIDRATTGTL
jgi:hypothetical protein